MEKVAKVFVGVDISKQHLDFHLYPINKSFRVENSKKGMQLLLSELSTHKDCIEVIACESTGGYESLMLKTVKFADYKTWRVDPARIKAFIKSEGKKSKTDKGDAAMIALFAAQKTQPYEVIERSEKETLLNELCKRKHDLKKCIASEKLRLEHEQISFCKKQLQKHIRFIEKQVDALEKEMNLIVDNDKVLKQKIAVAESVPGVGRATAIAMIAGLPELGKIGNRQISSLVGVAPFTNESGKYKGISRTAAGRSEVRQALFMAALSARTCNKRLRNFFEHLTEKGKRGMVAMVAVMRRLIVMINAMMRENVKWKEA
jgi:transposase